MERSTTLAGHARRDRILQAVAEHDNGWTEEDAAPVIDPKTGGVADFVGAPPAMRQKVWPRGVARLDDPWAAALVAQHAITVYDRYRCDPEWRPFFAGLEAMRDERVRACGGRPEDLQADYPFVRLGDLISLTFCTGWREEQRVGRWTVRLSGERVLVSPDDFAGAALPIEIAGREIRRTSFRSDADLRTALRDAAGFVLRGEVAGS